MNMKKDLFENNAHPFTVPDGYFDTLNERIMNRIQAEENTGRIIRMSPVRKWIAAAACILFISASAILMITYQEKKLVLSEITLDDDFYQWLFASDDATLMAESLDFHVPENMIIDETRLSEEDEAIIQFLERDNIQLAAILYSLDNEAFLFR